uniref:Acyltransferase 3 domain-containing protein n=1 Tax=Euplotes crassus TaxID=5936 RepID=A0A7S3P2S4_EUPCR|mmetsp:Transcript_9142/g.8751  ORF Transcript_9142/g.8751 Transcript_9142/m.8751 type:complete len:556 (+) Transcript_9142:325-1992(+)
MGVPGGEGMVHFPNKEQYSVSGWHIFGFIAFGFFSLFFIVGLFVEYTSLFGQVPPQEESASDTQKDKALVNSKSFIGKFFLAFSPSRNLQKMFYTPQKDDDYLSSLNGIRTISMFFVILGHTNAILAQGGVTNAQEALTMKNSWWAIFIGTGLYSVDTFFFISAFLATYLMLTKFHGCKIFNIPMVYLHRVIRVVPTILLLFALFFAFFGFLGSGPLWKPYVDNEIAQCKTGWWPTVLFIQSWHFTGACFVQLWYLSNEMTYFLFVPIIVLAYLNSKLIGYSIVAFFNVISIILPFIFSHIRGHSITILKDPAAEYMTEIYNYPWTRSGAYFVGVLFGILYFEYAKSGSDPFYRISLGARFYNLFKKNTLLCYISFFLSSIVMLFFIIFPRIELHDLNERKLSQIPSDFFNAFHRSTFVAALGFFLAPIFVGRLSLIKDFFGTRLWAPWAKVTFVAYLIHLHVLGWFFMQSKGSRYFDGPSQIFYALSTFLVCLIVGVPIALIIESPILQIERLVLFPPRQKPEYTVVQEHLIDKVAINSNDSSEMTKDDIKSFK